MEAWLIAIAVIVIIVLMIKAPKKRKIHQLMNQYHVTKAQAKQAIWLIEHVNDRPTNKKSSRLAWADADANPAVSDEIADAWLKKTLAFESSPAQVYKKARQKAAAQSRLPEHLRTTDTPNAPFVGIDQLPDLPPTPGAVRKMSPPVPDRHDAAPQMNIAGMPGVV